MLYTTEKQQYFFLITEDVKLPEGNFAIYAASGEKVLVDPLYLESYEVSSAEADAWKRQQKIQSDLINLVKSVGNNFLTHWQSAGKDEKPKRSNVNINFLADLLGESPEDLTTSSEASKNGFKRIFNELSTVANAAKTGNPDEMQEALAIASGIGDILRQHGFEVNENFDSLPLLFYEQRQQTLQQAQQKSDDKLARLLHERSQQNTQETPAEIRDVVDEIRQFIHERSRQILKKAPDETNASQAE